MQVGGAMVDAQAIAAWFSIGFKRRKSEDRGGRGVGVGAPSCVVNK